MNSRSTSITVDLAPPQDTNAARFLPLPSPEGCGLVLKIPPGFPSSLLRDVGRGVNRVPLAHALPSFEGCGQVSFVFRRIRGWARRNMGDLHGAS